ncbi:alpha/beta hydrolase [Kribbella sp. NPDC051952]|uniref:alpha/beta fold hydrolase n=1 Tax=Kribbella sp. NPDC051952 TaxID=3154851 RepID=UPI003432B74F
MKDLVCLHAATSGPATWDRFVPELEALGYRVHTPTLLGHGRAPRQRPYLLDDFRDQILAELDGLDRVTLVGNSLGAFVASSIAVQHPDRVERLILEEMPVPPRDARDSGPMTKPTPAVLLRAMGLLTHRRCDPVLLRDVITELRRPRPSWWAGLADLTAPTLLLAGGPKSHLDQSRFALVADVLPDAKVTTIEAGHRIHSHAPEQWLASAREFLAFKRT